jgi:hypothetical protein
VTVESASPRDAAAAAIKLARAHAPAAPPPERVNLAVVAEEMRQAAFLAAEITSLKAGSGGAGAGAGLDATRGATPAATSAAAAAAARSAHVAAVAENAALIEQSRSLRAALAAVRAEAKALALAGSRGPATISLPPTKGAAGAARLGGSIAPAMRRATRGGAGAGDGGGAGEGVPASPALSGTRM